MSSILKEPLLLDSQKTLLLLIEDILSYIIGISTEDIIKMYLLYSKLRFKIKEVI